MSKMICPCCWSSKRNPHTGTPCVYCDQTGVVEDRQLSPHFKLSEMLYSQTAVRHGISNDPTEEIVQRLTIVVQEVLEPIRDVFGPLHIDSGYRSPDLNKAVGGSTTSAHQFGWAADINPVVNDYTRKDVVDFLLKAKRIPFDQVIFEGTWVHVGRFNESKEERRMALAMFPDTHGKPHYGPYDPNDSRIHT